MVGQRIGYIRVNSLDQNTQLQLEGIQLDRIFTDKASGMDTGRPQLEELLGLRGDGDTLVVHRMDRLARNLDDLRLLVKRLTTNGVRIEFVKEPFVLMRFPAGGPDALGHGGVRRSNRSARDRTRGAGALP